MLRGESSVLREVVAEGLKLTSRGNGLVVTWGLRYTDERCKMVFGIRLRLRLRWGV